MSPYRKLARLEQIYRALGIALAIEMILRGVLVVVATLDDENNVYQVAASASLPFVLAGGIMIMACHLARSNSVWHYRIGQIGHALGMLWCFIFGSAIVVAWRLDQIQTPLAAPIFFLAAGLHLAFQIVSGGMAQWTRKQSS